MIDSYARRYVQPLIQRTAKVLINGGFTANQITWTAFLIGLGSGVSTYFGRPVLAVVLLLISGFLDAVDGSMARERKQLSAWGTLMDVTFDRIVELGIIVAIAIHHPQAQLLLLVLTAGIVFSMTVFLTVGALSERTGMKSFYYQAGLAERTEGRIHLALADDATIPLVAVDYRSIHICRVLYRTTENDGSETRSQVVSVFLQSFFATLQIQGNLLASRNHIAFLGQL